MENNMQLLLTIPSSKKAYVRVGVNQSELLSYTYSFMYIHPIKIEKVKTMSFISFHDTDMIRVAQIHPSCSMQARTLT